MSYAIPDAVQHMAAAHVPALLRTMPKAPDQVYVVHGEAGPADTLRGRIKRELGWRAMVPEAGSIWPT